MEKEILLIIKSAPFTNLNYYEGLRTAAGLWDHTVKILWTGKGVVGAMKCVDQTLTKKFLEDLPDLDIELFADEESVKAKGYSKDDLVVEIELADAEKISGLIEEAEASLVF